MEHADDQNPLTQIIAKDPRYAAQAYIFVYEGLSYTSEMLGLDKEPRGREEERHVSGQQLLEGLRQLALHQFGFLARTVWESWGIRATRDWGEIVFNLVNHGLMRKTDKDSIDDFKDGYDLTDAFETAFFRDRLYDEAVLKKKYPHVATASSLGSQITTDDDDADDDEDAESSGESSWLDEDDEQEF